LTSLPADYKVVTEMEEKIQVIAVPSTREINSATKRHYLSGHTIFITDEYDIPSNYTVTYTSPSGVEEQGLRVRGEHESAVFYGQLGEVGIWNLKVFDENSELLYSDDIEAVDEPLTK
jgi:hypothetical protein